MLRNIALAASALIGAAGLGRAYADRTIDARLETEIEAAKERALHEIELETGALVAKRLRIFAMTIAAKTSLLTAAYAAHVLGGLSLVEYTTATVGLLLGFVGFDLARAAPAMAFGVRFVRRYGVRPKRAIRAYVGSMAFNRAYSETREALQTGAAKRLVFFSTKSPDEISRRVAAAVSEVAGAMSYDRIKARVAVGLGKALLVAAVYAIFVAILVSA